MATPLESSRSTTERPWRTDAGRVGSISENMSSWVPSLSSTASSGGETSSCHCYTFELPENIQLLTDFNEWARSLRTQGVTVESFVAGLKDALSIAKRLDKVTATDTPPLCVLCNEVERRKYRLPNAHATHGLSSIGNSLQDPIGRAGGPTVLEGGVTTTSLGSLVVGGPMEAHECGYDEANHPGSENGWARPSDSIPARHAGLGSPLSARQCGDSVCFCEGMKDCRQSMGGGRSTNRIGPDNRVGPEKRSLTSNDLADECHRKHPKGGGPGELGLRRSTPPGSGQIQGETCPTAVG